MEPPAITFLEDALARRVTKAFTVKVNEAPAFLAFIAGRDVSVSTAAVVIT